MYVDLQSDWTELYDGNLTVPIVLPRSRDAIETAPPREEAFPATNDVESTTDLDVAQGVHNGLGVVSTLKQLAYRAARRLGKLEIAEIFSLDLRPLKKQPPAPSSFDFRFLAADQIRAAAADPANDIHAEMAERLNRGRNFCFGAFDAGRLVNYSWYAFGTIEREHSFGAGLTLPDDTVYMHKAFTLPAYRGRRLHQATVHRAGQIFARIGVRRLVAIIEYGNRASVRSHWRLGCRRVGRFWLVGQRLISWRCERSVVGFGEQTTCRDV